MTRQGAAPRAAEDIRRTRSWLPAVAALVLLVLLSLFLVTSFAVKQQFDREHAIRSDLQSAYEYRSLMRSVLLDMEDAETGQRGYLLTGEEAYLSPYARALGRLDGDLRQLSKAGPIADRAAIARLADLSRTKFGELAETIALRRRGQSDASLALVRSGRGQHDMESARSVIAADRARTSALMSRWNRLADDSAKTTERGALAVGALVLLTLAAFAALIGQVLVQRRRTIVAQARTNADITALLKTFAIAERVSNSGHWSLSSTGEHSWSSGMFPIFGLPVADEPPSVESVIALYAEQDRPKVEAQVAHAQELKTGFQFEAEILDVQGRPKHLCLEAEYVEDASGGALIGVVHDVTESREVQRALRESEERYRHLAESSTDMMATMAPDSTILFISPACRRILGYEPEELIGRKTLSITHPEDIPDVLAVFEGLRQAGPADVTVAYRFRGRHKDGGWVWLEGQPRVEFDEAGAATRYQDVVREIGSRKAAEEALETSRAMAMESERRYRLLAENATDMIARYGLDGTITYVSPACKQVLGYSVDELIGRSTLSLIHPDDLPRIREQFAGYLSSASPSGMATEHRVFRRDGSVIWLEGRPRLILDEHGAPLEYNDVMRDVTSRKRMESELREARSAAEAAARSKADFLANMSHELRTPLNSVVGFSGLISSAEELSDETRHRADIVRDSSRALVEIVNDILDFSKFESEGVTLLPEPTDLPELLRSVLELMQQQADVKGVQLVIALPAEIDPVLVDPSRLRQVLLNLLGNAIKFTESGSVTLSLTEAVGGPLTIAVSDTGVGIPEDRLDRIFERFAQADASTSRRFGGTGLGLAICSTIVRAMGGELGVTSVVGEGSTFRFTIDPPRPDPEIMEPETPAASASPVAGLRVLLADDNVFNQELFEALMAGRGLDVTYASNGREAVKAAREGDFDLVLMDMQMPVMDGLDATRAIRKEGLTQLPIVALTANVVRSQIDLCLAAGMDDHLAKPYTAEAALAVIAKWSAGRAESHA